MRINQFRTVRGSRSTVIGTKAGECRTPRCLRVGLLDLPTLWGPSERAQLFLSEREGGRA